MRTYPVGEYDIVVIGAGHAGVEAALAGARMGMRTLLLTLNADVIALLACNPSIGGTSKGHLVREVDALGGQMGLCADAAALQRKLINTSKGPAVQSLRSQTDKQAYQRHMKWVLENTPGLDLAQGECTRILTRGGRIVGITTAQGARYACRALVLATGVYLKGRLIIGDYHTSSGPAGLYPANRLSTQLAKLGLSLRRFKTGTPARIDGRTVDFSTMQPQPGDDGAPYFSFMTEHAPCPQLPCYLTYTNERTHEIIRANLHRSPLYTGVIEGTGPRYCPSIEDKVVRFAHKQAHQVFIEPEGAHTRELYIQGMSSCLPADVQIAMLRTLPGLERARVVRMGYAIEYDCIDPTQLTSTLAVRHIPGLYTAGQINGSSGYEEAAAQGLLAGINAVQYCRQEPPLILDRAQAYIGVLVDDLITKGTAEPYRMMTSRAEYRLLLRQDNADLRLTQLGYQLGLASAQRYGRMCRKAEQTQRMLAHFTTGNVTYQGQTARIAQHLRRPQVDYLRDLAALDDARPPAGDDAVEQAQIQIKYEGYIARQLREAERFAKLEGRLLPPDIDYTRVRSLRTEAMQKLTAQRPYSVGQAARISGVSPADIAVLLVYLQKIENGGKQYESRA